MKKILILANSSSGLYLFRNELLLELIKEYKVYISLPDYTNNEDFEKEGCTVIHTPIDRRGINIIQDAKLLFNYSKLLKEIKPDVILTYTIKPNIYGGLAARHKKIPYLTNITGLGSSIENGGLLQKLVKFLYKIALKKAKVVFFQNSANMKFFEDNNIVESEKILLPGSGVNVSKFDMEDMPNTSEFLFISRVMKEKGIEEYLGAIEIVKNKYPNVVFHILGCCEEDYKNRLDKEVQKGNIIYHGEVKDIRGVMERCQCLIHPSYHEGMSNVCLEASASKRAVITTNRPGCKETVTDGVTGYIVDAENTADLADKIIQFINLSYADKLKMGLEARKKMKEEFNRSIVVDKYLEIIERMR